MLKVEVMKKLIQGGDELFTLEEITPLSPKRKNPYQEIGKIPIEEIRPERKITLKGVLIYLVETRDFPRWFVRNIFLLNNKKVPQTLISKEEKELNPFDRELFKKVVINDKVFMSSYKKDGKHFVLGGDEEFFKKCIMAGVIPKTFNLVEVEEVKNGK